MCVTVAETLIVSSTLLACRNVFGYLYSNEKEVIDYVTSMTPLICLSVLMDSIQGVLSGTIRHKITIHPFYARSTCAFALRPNTLFTYPQVLLEDADGSI